MGMGLGDLVDVRLTGSTENDIIFYDGTKWVNRNIADAMNAYTWVLDGGDSVYEEVEPDPGPGPEPEEGTYAQQLSNRLLEIISSTDFKAYINSVPGLDSVEMNSETIMVSVSDKFEGLFDYFYDDNEISYLMGKIITAIYDNISGGIRQVLDNIDTDIWLTFRNAESGEADEFSLFIYFSDSSNVFYSIRVYFDI